MLLHTINSFIFYRISLLLVKFLLYFFPLFFALSLSLSFLGYFTISNRFNKLFSFKIHKTMLPIHTDTFGNTHTHTPNSHSIVLFSLSLSHTHAHLVTHSLDVETLFEIQTRIPHGVDVNFCYIFSCSQLNFISISSFFVNFFLLLLIFLCNLFVYFFFFFFLLQRNIHTHTMDFIFFSRKWNTLGKLNCPTLFVSFWSRKKIDMDFFFFRRVCFYSNIFRCLSFFFAKIEKKNWRKKFNTNNNKTHWIKLWICYRACVCVSSSLF